MQLVDNDKASILLFHANISDTLSSFSKNYLNCSNRQRTKDRYGLRTNDVRVGSVRSLPGQPEERVFAFQSRMMVKIPQ